MRLRPARRRQRQALTGFSTLTVATRCRPHRRHPPPPPLKSAPGPLRKRAAWSDPGSGAALLRGRGGVARGIIDITYHHHHPPHSTTGSMSASPPRSASPARRRSGLSASESGSARGERRAGREDGEAGGPAGKRKRWVPRSTAIEAEGTRYARLTCTFVGLAAQIPLPPPARPLRLPARPTETPRLARVSPARI